MTPARGRSGRRRALPRFTDRLALGATGLRVSPVCLGCVESDDAVTAAFDAGANFFFLTADLHWPIYEGLRRGLRALLARRPSVRDQIVVAAVSYVTQLEFPAGALYEALASVEGLERIDVAVLGGAYRHEFRRRVRLFRELREAGTLGIRAIGASFHDRQAALLAANGGLVDVGFVRYNPLHPGARQDLFPRLAGQRATRLYNFTNTTGYVGPARCRALGLGEQYWMPRITDYYRFAMTQSGLDGLLCAPATAGEVEALRQALARGPLSPNDEQYLIDLADLDAGRAVLADRH